MFAKGILNWVSLKFSIGVMHLEIAFVLWWAGSTVNIVIWLSESELIDTEVQANLKLNQNA